MKDKILILIIGILIGAILTTGGFIIYTKVNNNKIKSNMNYGPRMMQNGERPEMPGNGEKPPEMPEGMEKPQGAEPAKPEGNNNMAI